MILNWSGSSSNGSSSSSSSSNGSGYHRIAKTTGLVGGVRNVRNGSSGSTVGTTGANVDVDSGIRRVRFVGESARAFRSVLAFGRRAAARCSTGSRWPALDRNNGYCLRFHAREQDLQILVFSDSGSSR